MRIIAGQYKAREIKSPHGHRTHPMSEKLRGAIFNALGDIGGLSVFDPFAGTGAVALEALSRGASKAVCLDSNQDAYRAINENKTNMQASELEVHRINCSIYSDNNQKQKFDIVILDPPFDDIKPALINKLTLRHCVTGGLVILNLPTGTALDLDDDFELIQNNAHGDATLWFYRKIV